MLPMGHTNAIVASSFSPDNKRILTASYDNTAKLWDANTGVLLANFRHNDMLFGATFSPEGDKIITFSNDKTAKIWDVNSGSLIRLIDDVTLASFTHDGKKIITLSLDSTLKIWDAKSYKPLFDNLKLLATANSIDISQDNQRVVIATNDGSPQVWDIRTGHLIVTLKGHRNRCFSAVFSKDGNKIVSTSWDSTIKIWDAYTGKNLFTLKGHNKEVDRATFNMDGSKIISASHDNTAKIWDAHSGALLINLLVNDHSLSQNSFFSPNGALAVTTSDDGLKIWNAVSGKLITKVEGYTGYTDNIATCSFSTDGKKLITGDDIWDVKSGKLIFHLMGHTRALDNIFISLDKSKLIVESGDTTSKVWDISTLRFIGNSNKYLNPSYTSPDGKKILNTLGSTGDVEVWDLVKEKKILTLKGHTNWLNATHFSNDGKKIITTSWDRTAKVWDANSGNLLLDLKGHNDNVNSISYSNDSKYLLTSSDDKTAKIWDAYTGLLLLDLKGHNKMVHRAAFNNDGSKIVTASLDSSAKIWDAKTGQLLFTLKGHTGDVRSAVFDSAGRQVLTRSSDLTLKLWDANTGQLLHNLQGHTNDINNAFYSPDGKFIYSVSDDNTTRLWDANTGEFLSAFFAVDSSEFLVIDKNNRYDGSPAARKLLYFTCGTEVIELDQVKDQLWVPNLAERIMKGETINAKTLDELNICGLTPEVEDVTNQADEYHFKINPRLGGLGETVLNVNGIEAKRYKPEQLEKNGGLYELRIRKEALNNFFISGQENVVAVKAYTSDNAIASRGIKINEDKSKEVTTSPNLYAVMVGVSDYKGDEMDLKYAAKDATEISSAVANAAKKLLNTDGKEHVFMYNLTTAKDHYQLPEKNSIKKVLEDIGKKSTANDILMIFFAGHGVMQGEQKQFYFLTADASKTSATEAIADVGISTTELTEWMKPQNIKAQKRILIFDACNSGQAIKDFVKMGNGDQNYLAARNDDNAQQIKAIDKLNEKSGLFILSASSSNQSAYEMGRYAQGLLTYSLLKAIKQQPDILEAGKYLDVSRWFSAAEKTVSELAKESGARQEPQIVSNTNFNIGIVDAEVMAKIILPTEKPLFAASNFQNSEEAADGDNLEISKFINLQLNEIASRGVECKIVYVTATNSPDAYSLNGRYDVKGNDVTIRVSIKKSNETKYRFEEKGTKDELKELASVIVTKSAAWAAANSQ